jgi:hypothetical protein
MSSIVERPLLRQDIADVRFGRLLSELDEAAPVPGARTALLTRGPDFKPASATPPAPDPRGAGSD